MQAVLVGRLHQLVIGGMEIDLVDAIAESVVGLELRQHVVGNCAERAIIGAARQLAELLQIGLGPCGRLALHCLLQRGILGEYYLETTLKNVLPPDGYQIQYPFKNGEIDAIFNGNWTLGDYKQARPSVQVAPVPSGPGGNGSPLVGVDGYYINAASQNKDLAIAVAQALVDQAAQTIYVDVAGHVPANKSITIIDPLVKQFSDAFALGMARPQGEEMNNYWGNFDNAWKEVLDKGTDATTAVAKACADMDTANGK